MKNMRESTLIGILIPGTSRNAVYKNCEDIELFKVLLPSFFNSLTAVEKDRFCYRFYLGYDAGDELYDNERNLKRIREKFARETENRSIQMEEPVRCAGTEHSPAYVWNILFKKAYDDGCDYFYQLGDDIELLSDGWSSIFVNVLKESRGVGVTGPMEEHNRRILTQTFVSRVHMDIFGYYFTPIVKNWSCDDWLHNVYMPDYNFWRKDVLVRNTSVGTTKYDIDNVSAKKIRKEIKKDRKKLIKWLNYHGFAKESLLERTKRMFTRK
ncbi:MAG: hypothetical protein ABIH68_04245 [bacterium]